MAAPKTGIARPTIMLSVAALLTLLAVFVWGMSEARVRAYNKLSPLSVELSVTAAESQQLVLQYDYGYGFNSDHTQSKHLPGDSLPQTLKFTVSTWKPLRRLQVTRNGTESLILHSSTLSQSGNVLRLLLGEVDQGGAILLDLEEPMSMLGQGGLR